LKIPSRQVGSTGDHLSRGRIAFLGFVDTLSGPHVWKGSSSKHQELEKFPCLAFDPSRRWGRLGFGRKELEPQPGSKGHQVRNQVLVNIHISNEGKEQGEVKDKGTQEGQGENHHMGQKKERSRIELERVPQR